MTDFSHNGPIPDGLRLGLSSGALYPDVVTEQVLEIAADWGIADVELMLQTPGEHEPAFLRAVTEEARARGQRIDSVHSFQEYYPLFSHYQRRTNESLAIFERLIEDAGDFGVRAIVWHGPRREVAPSPDRWGTFLDITAQLADRCAKAGVILALENVSWCALATVRDLIAFAARIPELGPPGSIGFTFDPFQAIEAKANPFMVLAAMEPYLVNVHLSDAREGDADTRHLPPGDGDLPWSALLRAIQASGYRGPMKVEGRLDRDGNDWRRVRDLLDPIITQLAGDGDDLPLPSGVIEGIALFNSGNYYEAHESLEHEWHAERGSARRLYQGILQIGVGLHHTRSGNHRGAVLLLTDGIEKTSGFVPTYRGLDTARLVREAQSCLDQVTTLGPERLNEFDWGRVPVIELPGA